MAIQSFGDTISEEFFYDGTIPPKGCGWANISSTAARKLDMLHAADKLFDLRSPPNNRLEKLRGDLTGYYSIRINNQWRIIFKWTEDGPKSVTIVDFF